MKRIKEAYYYLFYRFYLFCETPPFVNDSDWKAAGFMAILEIFIFFSGCFYYKIYFNRSYIMEINSPLFIIVMGIILMVKYLAFLRNDAWMDYNEIFESWPLEKNKKAGRIVLATIIGILICFSLAIYLFNKINGFKR
jgi:hypothetical protein